MHLDIMKAHTNKHLNGVRIKQIYCFSISSYFVWLLFQF